MNRGGRGHTPSNGEDLAHLLVEGADGASSEPRTMVDRGQRVALFFEYETGEQR